MALEAVVFQQDQLFGHSNKDLYSLLGGNWGSYEDFGLEKEDNNEGGSFDFLDNQADHIHHSSPHSLQPQFNELLHQSNTSLDGSNIYIHELTAPLANDLHQLDTSQPSTNVIMPHPARAKRRRSRKKKNKEEIENQRMTHIAVERNRRKQMNEYLCVLRTLMPEHYVQRGDQASIIGGAINFVKELEQRLQLLGGRQRQRETNKERCDGDIVSQSLPFTEFFTFPQFSTSPSTRRDNSAAMGETMRETLSAIADIEVTMVETHANLKIRLSWRPKQLSKVVSGLHTMRLTILHLNVTTVDQFVLYSLGVKVEEDCKLSSVEEIATAVHQMLGRIQEETILN